MSDIPAPLIAADSDRFCPACGYDLRGITSDRCPECGLAIDKTRPESIIPWTHRHQIGRGRAFFRTAVLATFRPKKLAGATGGPVDYPDAQRFRQIVVVLASLWFIAFLFGMVALHGGTAFLSLVDDPPLDSFPLRTITPLWELAYAWSAGATLVPVLSIGILLTVAMCTAVVSWWFHPNSLPMVRQNRAVAVSQYACAPLVWVFLPLTAITGALAVGAIPAFEQNAQLVTLRLALWFAGGLLLLIIPWHWWTLVRVLSGTTHCQTGRVAAAGVGVPLMWAMSIAIGAGVVPAVLGFCWLMLDSLR